MTVIYCQQLECLNIALNEKQSLINFKGVAFIYDNTTPTKIKLENIKDFG